MQLMLAERDYKPEYDTSVRSWSRTSLAVAKAVHEVDETRIDALKTIFVDAGYEDDEAFVRAGHLCPADRLLRHGRKRIRQAPRGTQRPLLSDPHRRPNG
jgi:hypothetical protein